MSTAAVFDPSPPSPYSGNWEEAARADKEDAPRFTTYQAPGGKPIPFIQERFSFRGGQSVDTSEYPFHGRWSNESLNEKKQELNIAGYVRGANYIAKRNALIQALRVTTDDDNPGYIDFPFWGRFPVVVTEYEISEKADEQGQCALSLTFTRAGVTVTERLAAIPDTEGLFDSAKETVQAAVSKDFEAKLKKGFDANAFKAAFLAIKMALLDIVGRVQAAKTTLSNITGSVSGITSLLNQALLSPKELAAALFNAASAIAGSIKSVGAALNELTASDENDEGAAVSGTLVFTQGENNTKNALTQFLAAADFTLALESATVSQHNTKTAAEYVYRAAAFLAASELLLDIDNISYEKTAHYWKLLRKLESSIDHDNPAVYSALQDLRVAVSRSLSARELSGEMRRTLNAPLPLLYLAHYLGCDAARLRELNGVADSFVIQGSVVYV